MSQHGRISREFAEQVRSAADIVRIISGYVSLKRKGDRYWGCCPFHNEKTPSFSVKPDNGFYYCFGCHAGGNVFNFIANYENISYYEAVARVAEDLNIPLPQREVSQAQLAKEKHIEELRQINQLAGKFFHNCLTMTSYGRQGMAYFQGRGINEDIIKEFNLGFAPDAWDKLTVSFQKRDIKADLLVECDLTRKSHDGKLFDRFRNRVMIPICDERGRIAGFGGRIIQQGQREQAKYLNTGENVLFNKRRLLFGLDKAYRHIVKEQFALVVEGYMDAISVAAAGIRNVVASLGTAFTQEQCRKLLRYAPGIYFCYDSDDAGQAAIFRAAEIAGSQENALVKAVQLPDGKDPDEFIRKHGAEAFRQVIARAVPIVEFQLQYIVKGMDLSSLENRLLAMSRMLPILGRIRHLTSQNVYIARAAQILGVQENELRSELSRRGGSIAAVQRSHEPVRQAVRQADDAARKAGRVVLKAVWQEPAVLAHFQGEMPLEAIPDPLQAGLLRQMADMIEKGEPMSDVMQFAALGEASVEELSRVLVEDFGTGDFLDLYHDCVIYLKKRYLEGQLALHNHRAEQLGREGKDFRSELERIQIIQKEMDEL